MPEIDFKKETEYLLAKVKLAVEFDDGITDHMYGRLCLYLSTEREFHSYVEIAAATQRALNTRNWERIRSLIHLEKKEK